MVFSRTKQMSFLVFAILVMVLFSGCFGYIYSEKEIRTIASDKLSKVNIGMTVKQVHSIIGEPENIYPQKNTNHYRTWIKTMQNETLKIYPENLIDNLPDTLFEHIYSYKFAEIDSFGFAFYFNDKDELLGWDCDTDILPDNWDDICAKQDKLRLPTQQK